jgi:hypothetical protein
MGAIRGLETHLGRGDGVLEMRIWAAITRRVCAQKRTDGSSSAAAGLRLCAR